MRTFVGFLGFLFSLGSIAVVAGVALIAGVVWVYDRDLPDHQGLTNYQPATLSRVYSGEGAVIAEYARERSRRIFTPIEEIPDLVKHAFVSAEDKNFFTHSGVDGFGVVKAMVDNVRRLQSGQRLRGASTITQQVIKNFLLSSDGAVERKIKEFILSGRIESVLSKDKILELYLNDIFLGQNAYGITAAARRYFGKVPEDLTVEEAAYLAALPKAPSSYHPLRQTEAAIARRNYVLEEMAQNGYLPRDEAEEAKKRPLVTLFNDGVESQLPGIPNYTYFTDEIRRQLSDRLGADMLFEGGLTVRATIDPELQQIAERAMRRKLLSADRERSGWRGPLSRIEELNAEDEESWRAALSGTLAPSDIEGWVKAVVLSVEEDGARIGIHDVPADLETQRLRFADVKDWARPETRSGRIGERPNGPEDVWSVGDVVMVEAVTREDGSFDRWVMRQLPKLQGAFVAMDPHTGRILALVGGFSYEASVFNRATQALRQPGSSFKPFVYAAALDNGYSPATIVLDAPVVVRQTGKDWKPKNYSNRFYGPSPLRLGLEKSRNLMTVRLAQDVGMDVVADYGERFGIYEDMPAHLSYSLGAGETTLFKMVTAYSMFANGGLRIEPTLVDRVQNRRGETIYRHDRRRCDACRAQEPTEHEPWPEPDARRIMDPVTAYQLVSMLEGVASRGTASRLSSLGFPVAGKTGTTNESKDAWFVGFTPGIVAGCFVGYDNPTPMGKGGTGGGMCVPVFEDFMREAMKTRTPGTFAVPPEVVFASVDRFTGRRLPDGSKDGAAIREAFRADQAPALYQTAAVIGDEGGLASFFGSGDLPMTLSDGDGEDDSFVATGGNGGGDGGAPKRPRPSRPLDADLESGGLY